MASMVKMKNEDRIFPEQDDIVNSLNYEGIAVIGVAALPLFLTGTDCVGSVTD